MELLALYKAFATTSTIRGTALPTEHENRIQAGIALALMTSLVASTAAAAAKLLSQDFSPWLVVWVQYGLCSVLMLPWLLRHGITGVASRRMGLHVARSLAGWLGFTCYYLALPLISLVDASLLRSAAPLWVPAVVWLVWRQSVPMSRWWALLTGFAGVCLVLTPDTGQLNPGHLLGLAAGAFLAISMASTRALSTSEPASRVLFYYFTISFVASTPMALANFSPIPVSAWPGFVWVGVSIFITMALYTKAYSLAPTSVVAPLSYVAVPAAAMLDWLVWQQLPSTLTLAGSALVIGSGILAMTVSSRTQTDH